MSDDPINHHFYVQVSMQVLGSIKSLLCGKGFPLQALDMNASDSRALGNLPDELLLLICSNLSTQDQFNMMLVCRKLKSVVPDVFYVDITIIDFHHPSAFRRAITRDNRAGGVRCLTLRCTQQSASSLVSTIETFENLEELTVDTPCLALDIIDQFPIERSRQPSRIYELFEAHSLLSVPADRILPRLISCDLDFRKSGEKFWLLQSIQWLALSPSVKRLTLRGCYMLEQDFKSVSTYYYRTTPLRELFLVESFINVDSLQRLLCFPRALEAVKLDQTETKNYTMRAEHIAESYQDFLDPLLQHRKTLHYLELTKRLPVDWRRETELLIHCDFSEFEALRALTIDGLRLVG